MKKTILVLFTTLITSQSSQIALSDEIFDPEIEKQIEEDGKKYRAEKKRKQKESESKKQSNGMVFVEGGIFEMGDGKNDDNKSHQVTLSSFYIAKYEVTQSEYLSIMDYLSSNKQIDTPINNNPATFKGDNLPIETISWYDSIHFCNLKSKKEKLPIAYKESTGELLDQYGNVTNDITKVKGYRLPTEAEWEYAARSNGKNYKYSWGNGEPTINSKPADNIADESFQNYKPGLEIWQNYNDGYQKTSAVGSFEPNELGLFDINGNVHEWCTDRYDENYYKNSPQINPYNSISSDFYVNRGGSWSVSGEKLLLTYRNYGALNSKFSDVGIRLAKTK